MIDLSSDKLRSLLEEALPGPWSITESSEHWGLIKCTIRSFGSDVATTWQQYTYLNRANARLIAAAPDLAAEVIRLREALELCADVTERWPDSLARQVNEIARAALTEPNT